MSWICVPRSNDERAPLLHATSVWDWLFGPDSTLALPESDGGCNSRQHRPQYFGRLYANKCRRHCRHQRPLCKRMVTCLPGYVGSLVEEGLDPVDGILHCNNGSHQYDQCLLFFAYCVSWLFFFLVLPHRLVYGISASTVPGSKVAGKRRCGRSCVVCLSFSLGWQRSERAHCVHCSVARYAGSCLQVRINGLLGRCTSPHIFVTIRPSWCAYVGVRTCVVRVINVFMFTRSRAPSSASYCCVDIRSHVRIQIRLTFCLED